MSKRSKMGKYEGTSSIPIFASCGSCMDVGKFVILLIAMRQG
jgi:hypothetical protein